MPGYFSETQEDKNLQQIHDIQCDTEDQMATEMLAFFDACLVYGEVDYTSERYNLILDLFRHRGIPTARHNNERSTR